MPPVRFPENKGDMLMSVRNRCLWVAAVCVGWMSGCGDRSAVSPTVAIDVAPYLLSESPGDAEEVKSVHAASENERDVVIVGKIGGRSDPWIEGRAAFNIVDRSVKSCSDIPGDGCRTPWDYCCTQDDLSGATALVKVVGGDGRALSGDARKLFGVKELQTVIIKGTARKDQAGNLTVVASGLFLEK